MSVSREAYEKVLAEKCTCERCGFCHGRGEIRIGTGQFDEEDETCEWCSGGIIEVCSRCELLEEMEMERHER